MSLQWKTSPAFVLAFCCAMLPLGASPVTTYTFSGTYTGNPMSTFGFTVNLPETLSQVENLSGYNVPSADFTANPVVPSVSMNAGYVFTGETFASDSLSITGNSMLER